MRHLGQSLVFAVAQRSFESNNGIWFSTLVPLATIDGEAVDRREFPNRGLAWWMVRGVADLIRSRPGRLLTAVVEEAAKQNVSDPERDLYQVDFDTVQVAGPKRLIEIVTPEYHGSMKTSFILNGAKATLDHEPTSLVLVRLGSRLYGPFKGETEEDVERRGRFTVRFSKASGDRPISNLDGNAVPLCRFAARVDVSKAIEGATARAVSERASSIRAEAAQQEKDVRQALEDRRKELASVDADLERRRRVREAEIEGELSARKESVEIEIKKQRDSIARQQAELDRQRKVIEQNLSKVVRSFSEEKDKLITDFLAIRPILESAGVLGNRATADRPIQEPEAHPTRQDSPICLPEVLSSERGRAAISSEVEFFERFRLHVEHCGFSYRPIDLLSFHVSVKCSDLSVIGGVSGTGKSSLPRLYAQALAGDDHDQVRRFLAVDVSPAWMNPSDLLGYVNLLDRSFHPGASGMFTHVVWAAMEVTPATAFEGKTARGNLGWRWLRVRGRHGP